MEFHQGQLEKSCRVCGNRLRTTKGKGRAFNCSAHMPQLLQTFSVDVISDNKEIHPPQFCFSCFGIIRRKAAATKKGVPYTTPALHNTYTWTTHREGDCRVSKMLKWSRFVSTLLP
jgi:hypothetical protein